MAKLYWKRLIKLNFTSLRLNYIINSNGNGIKRLI